MYVMTQSDAGHVDLDTEHVHREYHFPLPLRDAAATVRPAVGAIEVRCEDALPWSGIDRESHSWVWKHLS
jgi:hypothetical protein